MARAVTSNHSSLTTRSSNFRLVLDQIWTVDAVSRADIARRTGLSRTTISDIVSELIEIGVVEEFGSGTSRGGRRPILLRPVPESRALIGVEAGASHIDVVVMNLTGGVIASESVVHRMPHDVEGTLDKLSALVSRCVDQSGIEPSAILGLGVAVSSPLHGEDLRHVSPVTMPAWEGIDLVSTLEERIGLPVRMDNDANLGAVAERWWGAGRGCDDFTYIKLGVGVGAGHIADGHLYRGSRGTAGELGHIHVPGSDQPCRCGLVGCIETEIGSDAIVAQYIKAVDGPLSVTIDDVVHAANAGAPAARRIVARAGRLLGDATAPIVTLLNPSKIIISGPLVQAKDVFLEAVVETARLRAQSETVGDVEFVISELEQLTVAIGAATAALQVAFNGGAGAWELDRRSTLATTGVAL